MRRSYLVSFIFILFFSVNAFALRCGSNLVLEGDHKFEVINKCGEPTFIEQWKQETETYEIVSNIENFNADHIRASNKTMTSFFEEWTYNFGSNRFIYFLTFINGKLNKIVEGSKGVDGDLLSGSTKTRCGQMVEAGDKKIEVIRKCGDPAEIEYLWEDRYSTNLTNEKILKRPPASTKDEPDKDRGPVKVSNYEDMKSRINIEEWTYNFGPKQFLYFIRMENGKVVKISEGGYGY